MGSLNRSLPAVVIALTLLTASPPAGHALQEEIVWDKIERGILYTTIRAEEFTDEGAVWIHVYNIDTSRYAFRIFDSMDLPGERPLSFSEWYRQTDAPLLFNVCPEKDEKGPRGYVRLSGTTVWAGMNRAWKGLLALGPSDGSLPATRILDMDSISFDPLDPRFMDVIQQPMLLDEAGNLRVSPREYRATRIAMGQDENRNTLVFLTESPCTLWEMARWLRDGPFSLSHAISLGRGNESQVLGRFPPERIYIVGETGDEDPGKASGSILRELSSDRSMSYILGVEPISR
jgi:hypothetical protein